MKNAAQTRIMAIVLALATVAACVLAAMNFEQESRRDDPTDGGLVGRGEWRTAG